MKTTIEQTYYKAEVERLRLLKDKNFAEYDAARERILKLQTDMVEAGISTSEIKDIQESAITLVFGSKSPDAAQ